MQSMTDFPGDRGIFTTRFRSVGRSISKHENIVLALVMLALVAGFGAATRGSTLLRENVINVLLQSSVRGIASIGQAFVILTAGIDVSVAGVGLLCSIVGAGLMTANAGQAIVSQPIAIYGAIPIMLLLASALGAFNGMSVSRLGMPPLIVTLAVWQITLGLGFWISGGNAISGLPDNLGLLGGTIGISGIIPVPVVVFIVVSAVAYCVLQYTRFGRSIYAVGGNPSSAWLSGINVKNVLLSAYIISGFLTGLASVIFTARVMAASMQTLLRLEMETIAAVTIGGISLAGGRGNIIGVVLGVLVVGILNNGMFVMGRGLAERTILTGVVMLCAVGIDYIRRAERSIG